MPHNSFLLPYWMVSTNWCKEESEVAAVHIGLSTNGLQERCFLLVVSLHKQYVLDLFEECVDLIRTLLTTFWCRGEDVLINLPQVGLGVNYTRRRPGSRRKIRVYSSEPWSEAPRITTTNNDCLTRRLVLVKKLYELLNIFDSLICIQELQMWGRPILEGLW